MNRSRPDALPQSTKPRVRSRGMKFASLAADARPASHLRLGRQIAIRAATLTAQRQIGFAGF
jgi:hypothetical protein